MTLGIVLFIGIEVANLQHIQMYTYKPTYLVYYTLLNY